MLGRLRTASRPSSTVIEDAPYSFFFVVTGLFVTPVLAHGPDAGRAFDQECPPGMTRAGDCIDCAEAIGG